MLLRNRIPPSVRRIGPTWAEFLRAHAGAVLACDFIHRRHCAAEDVVCPRLHRDPLPARSICQLHRASDSAWVTQQARNLTRELSRLDAPIQLYIHDRDRKFIDDFDQVLRAEGAQKPAVDDSCSIRHPISDVRVPDHRRPRRPAGSPSCRRKAAPLASPGRGAHRWRGPRPQLDPRPTSERSALASLHVTRVRQLMLGAGTEVDLASKQLRAGAVRGALALLVASGLSVPIGVALGSAIQTHHVQLLVVLLAGSSAAVAFPIILERRLEGSTVAVLIAWMTHADAVTALLMTLTLSRANGIPLAILGDGLIVAVAAGSIVVEHRLFQTRLGDEAKRESKNRSWALQLRISVLLLLVLAAIAEATSASLLIAGFAAGIVLRQFHQPHRLIHQLTGLATGFFVPAFFVLLGATLDVSSLIDSPSSVVLALAMALGATTVHVIAAFTTGSQSRIASGLLASAQLGLPAAAAALGLASNTLTQPIAAALVAGGLLTLISASVGAAIMAARRRQPYSRQWQPRRKELMLNFEMEQGLDQRSASGNGTSSGAERESVGKELTGVGSRRAVSAYSARRELAIVRVMGAQRSPPQSSRQHGGLLVKSGSGPNHQASANTVGDERVAKHAR